MPKNKQESIVYGVIMCFFMAFGMSIYSMLWQMGWKWDVLPQAWLGLPLAFAVALTLDELLVAKPAKAFAHKITSKKDSHIHKMLAISLSMVVPMVILMSIFGAIMAILHGAQAPFIVLWGVNIIRNLPMAIFINVFIAGPATRCIFGWIFRKKDKQLEKLAEEEA